MGAIIDLEFWSKFCDLREKIQIRLNYCSWNKDSIDDIILYVYGKKNISNLSKKKKELLLNILMDEFMFSGEMVENITNNIINKYEDKYDLVERIVLSQTIYEFIKHDKIGSVLKKLDDLNALHADNTLTEYCLVIENEQTYRQIPQTFMETTQE